MDRYDIAVIGTGPAGISAAITANIRNKSVLLLGSRKLSDKMTKAERIDNYPGLPGISGRELAERMTAHLDSLGISVTEGQVGAVYTYGDRFVLQIGEETAEATAVILAGGVVLGKPLPGEEEFLGRGVSYCATCDGRLYRGKTVAVIAQSAEAPEEADYLAEIVGQVLYFPGKTAGRPKDPTVTVLDEIPTGIRGGFKADTLVTDRGEHAVDCVFILKDAVPPGSLVPGVETDGPHVRVGSQMETNLPGLFACGDIAGRPYQYIKAAGQGNVAALSAVSYLNQLK